MKNKGLKSQGIAKRGRVVRSSAALRGKNRIADLAEAVYDRFKQIDREAMRRCMPSPPWIPKSWKRMTPRRLAIADGMDHYWNFHKRPEPGCPICWEQSKANERTTRRKPSPAASIQKHK